MQPVMENQDLILTRLLNAADAHGEDSGEPDHSVGDLRELVTSMWRLLTPSQRLELLNSSTVDDLAEAGARGEWEPETLIGLVREDLGSLETALRDVGYQFMQSELGFYWETADETDAGQQRASRVDAVAAAGDHYYQARRDALLAIPYDQLKDYLEGELKKWPANELPPIVLRAHLGLTKAEFSAFRQSSPQFAVRSPM